MKISRFISMLLMAVFAVSCEQAENPGNDGQTDTPPSVVRVGIMGDSISTFEGELVNDDYKFHYPCVEGTRNNPCGVSKVEQTWWWQLINEKMENGVLDVNNSFSGTKVSHGTYTGISGAEYEAGFVDRVEDFIDPDVIIIHGGTNDCIKDDDKVNIGDYQWDTPLAQMDLTKFRSAYVYLVRKLQELYDGVQLILIVGDRLGKDAGLQYDDTIIEIARHFGLPYVDLTPHRLTDIPAPDLCHPSDVGHAFIAQKVYDTCKDYLKAGRNPEIGQDMPAEFAVTLDFAAGWPFNEPCAEPSVQTKDGEPYTYSFAYDSNGQTKTTNLDFMISHGTVNTSIDYSYSDGALRFNSTGGNNGEIKLPGIEGYYLSRVDARHISAERSRFALKDYFIANTESLNERFLDGYTSSGALTMFWMPVTNGLAEKQQPGQSFTLEMRDKNMAVSEIKLVYTKTKPTGAPALDLNGRHLYAHRGKWSKEGSDYFIPENSLTGIQMAALMGYEGIECDVKYTKDNVMVVMHDATINKSMRNVDYTEISGDVKVADLTFDELRNNYVLESTEPAFRLQCPTLEEMLLECKRCGMRPMLHSSIYESYELAQKIMGDNWVCFTGANFENVLKVRSELKSKCTVLWSISSGFDTIETELEKIGGDCGISSMKFDYYSKEMIDRLRNGGYHVQCSIFPSGDEHLAIENGVDYILTDRVIPMGARTDITAAEILAAYPPLPEEITLSLDFTKGWPFVEPCVAEADQDTENGDVYTYKYSYTSSEGTSQVEDLKFVLYARAADNTYSYDVSKPSDGLYAGPAIGQGNYSLQIKVPGVSNRYFKSIHFTSPNETSGQWTLSKGVYTGGTSNVSSSYKGDHTWTFPYTSQAGTPVEIGMGVPCVVRARRANGRLYTLDITYTKTKPE